MGDVFARKQEVERSGKGFWEKGQLSRVWDQTLAVGRAGTGIAGHRESFQWLSIPVPSCFSSSSGGKRCRETRVLPKIYNLTFLVLEPSPP